MKSKDKKLNKQIYSIDEIKNIISPIAKDYGVERVFLFGSYARGDATEKSDIDICIDKGRVKSLFELSGLLIDLKENLGKPVDIVTRNSLEPKFLDNIKNEEIILYEQ